MELTVSEARRLHEEAPAMTAKELRRIGRHYGYEWVSKIAKAQLVKVFRKTMQEFVEQQGEKL